MSTVVEAEEMEIIRQRLKEMEEFRGFANIGRVVEVLEELWRCWGCGVKAGGQEGTSAIAGLEREVSWEDVCWRRGWVLMLA